MNDYRNGSNTLQGFTQQNSGSQQEAVYDAGRNYLGYTSSQGTFDAQGRRVSTQQAPGLLLR